jgi:alkylated DNA repair dioxygenase AlkB
MQDLQMPDAEVFFDSTFFTPDESEHYFRELTSNIQWKEKQVETPTATFALPRLIAWYGDEDTSYSYSGVTLHPLAWTPPLLEIKSRVESAAATTFNSVLLNLYRSEQDSVSWHSDDEPELGMNPVIASVSFGATRPFQFKHKHNPDLRLSLDLTPGSLLLMRGTTQAYWKHQIPKSKVPCRARINLTFRTMLNPHP